MVRCRDCAVKKKPCSFGTNPRPSRKVAPVVVKYGLPRGVRPTQKKTSVPVVPVPVVSVRQPSPGPSQRVALARPPSPLFIEDESDRAPSPPPPASPGVPTVFTPYSPSVSASKVHTGPFPRSPSPAWVPGNLLRDPTLPPAPVEEQPREPVPRRSRRHRRTFRDDTFLSATAGEVRTRLLVAQETLRVTEAELNRWLAARNLANDMIYGLRDRVTDCAAEVRAAQWAFDAEGSDDSDFSSRASDSDTDMEDAASIGATEEALAELGDLDREAQRED